MQPHKLPDSLLGRHLEVSVAGAGGNGSQILNGLARMHLALLAVGHPGLSVTAFDPDTVSQANVGRQLFSPSDIGQNKATVLIHRLNCYYGLNWQSKPSRYADRVGTYDLLIGCVDTIAARRELARAAAHYWLDLGNRDRTGQVILGCIKGGTNTKDPTRPLTVTEMFPELLKGKPKEDDAPSCSLAAALERQDLFINQTVATFALQLLWSFIRHGQLTHQGYFINLETGRVVPIPVPQPKEDPNRATKGKPLSEVLV